LGGALAGIAGTKGGPAKASAAGSTAPLGLVGVGDWRWEPSAGRLCVQSVRPQRTVEKKIKNVLIPACIWC
jgi:hypothetical protein